MNGRVRTPALVLHTRAFKEADLIVECLGEKIGRFSVVARGARKSQRRFGGPLELGTRLDVEVIVHPGRDLHGLRHCEVTVPLRAIREDLDRIIGLAYILELVRHTAREGMADPELYGLAVGIVDALEATPLIGEALILWELALMAQAGHQTSPLLLAHEAGFGPATTALFVRLAKGDPTAQLPEPAHQAMRAVLSRRWQEIIGRPLRSAQLLNAAASGLSAAAHFPHAQNEVN